MKRTVCWNVTPCTLMGKYRLLLLLSVGDDMLLLSVGNDVRLDEDGGRGFFLNVYTIYETTRRHIQEYNNFIVTTVRIANFSFPLVSVFTVICSECDML